MKKLFLLLISSLYFFNSLAQVTPDTWCTTTPPTQSQKGVFLQKFQLNEATKTRKGAETVTNVALKIHLLSKSDGNIELNDNDIKELLDTLNFHFIDTKIQFYLCGGVDYINDDTYYKFDTQSEAAFCKAHDVNNAINLYLVKEFTNPGLGGYAYFPTSDRATNRIFCAYKNRDEFITKIVPHEMGHYFGLLHTFQDSNWEGYSEVVTRGEKANCAYYGDLICDTPADPYGAVSYQLNGCQFSSTAVDINGERYSPQIGNLMSYYRGCGNFFTPGQISMMKTGLLIRLIQDNNKEKAYSIDCEGVISNTIAVQDVYVNGINKSREGWPRICVEKPFSVTFTTTGNFKPDNEFRVNLISSRRNFSAEVGRGTGKEIICTIPKDFPVDLASCYIQIASTSPAMNSSFSSFTIYGNKLPTAEISGTYSIFENEQLDVPIKLSGGTVNIRLNNVESGYSFGVGPNQKIFLFGQLKTGIISFNRVWNECGDGVGKGRIELNVAPKPVAKNFSIANLSSVNLCEGKPVMVSVKADGIFKETNTFKLYLSDKEGDNFKEIAHNTTTGGVLELKVPDVMAEGDNYRIKVVSTSPYIESVSEKLSVQAKAMAVLSGDTTIVNGQKAKLQVYMSGKTPFKLITSEGDSLLSHSNLFNWEVSPTEDKVFSLKSVSNDVCGNGTVQGNATVKVNYGLRTSTLNIPFACADTEIKIPYEVQDGTVIENEYVVQLSDKTGKNFTTIGSGGRSPLIAIIPANTPEGANYRVRVVSKSGAYIGSESNEFEIRQKPTATLSGSAIGNKGTTAYLNVRLTGGGPWNIPVKSGDLITSFYSTQNPTLIPVTIGNNIIYQLDPITNACGAGKSFGQVASNVRENASNYCTPIVNQETSSGRITRVRLTDIQGNMLLNSFDIKMGTRNYTDNTAMVANLKPGNSYNYDVLSSDNGSETYFSSNQSYYFVIWIDYDQNGRFDRNETIVENALSYSVAQFTVPENIKRGVTRMRVKTYRDNPEMVLNNSCYPVSGGETEDYTINITDDASYYSVQMTFEERALCKVKEYEFPFTATGTFSESNTFRVALYNSFGNFMGYIGESKTSPIKIKFPIDIPIGANYKLKIIASEPYYEGIFTKAFRINDIPTATLSGNQTAYFGQEIPLNIVLDGGADWSYSVGNGGGGIGNSPLNKIILSYPGGVSYMTPKPGIYDFKMNQVVNSACGNGKVYGSARVEVLEPDSSATISRIKTQFSGWLFNQAIYRCKDYSFAYRISFETKGTFNKDNYFTCYLISPDDKFVAIVGYTKTNILNVDIPTNIEGFGYKIKVVSSSPYSESPLSQPFIILPKVTAKISGYSEILPGEQGTIQLSLTGSEPWNISLSDGTTVSTGVPFQSLKVSPASTQVYTIKRVYANPCDGEVSGAATVKVLKSRASTLRIQQPNELCIGGNVVLGFRSNGSFRERNNFKVALSDNSGAKFKDIEAKLINDSTLYFMMPPTVPPGEDYKIKLIATSPYLESDLTNTFKLRPLSTATISSEVKSVYEKSTIRLRVDFTGDGPYNIELSDGRQYENITQNPYFIDLKATIGINKYTITRVVNTCGQGKAIGSANFNVMPLPIISTQPLRVNTTCTGNKIVVPFIVSNGEFQPDNTFKVDLFDVSHNTWRLLETTIENDSLFAIIPYNLSGGTYTVRVNGTSPAISGSLSVSRFTIKTYPTATITGRSSVMEGDVTSFQIAFSGDAPWTVTLSNGKELENISSNPLLFGYMPQKSETLTITSIKNVCGEGTFTGQASIVVHKLEDIENLVKIYPIPFQDETQLYIDEALMKEPASYTITDILGRTVAHKKDLLATEIPIDLNFSPPGIYYVRITTDKKAFFRKIVK